MNIIVAGGRNFENYTLLKFKLNKILKTCSDITIIEGGAQGADRLARKYAKEKGYKYKTFEANWNDLHSTNCLVKVNKQGFEYNALAGHNRNLLMADNGVALVAFWDGQSTGTKDMIEIAKNKGLPVRVIKYA